jgi:putative phosphoribosyl transferase
MRQHAMSQQVESGRLLRFRDRIEAGQRLGALLARDRRNGDGDVLVLALPRGGVPVGYEVARALHAPLDVFLVRKLGVPGQHELAMGAIAPGGVTIINQETVRLLGITPDEIERVAAGEVRELERRLRRFRGERPLPELRDRTVMLVDDGLATGSSAMAAIEALRRLAPRRIVLAVPVCPAEAADALGALADEVVCAQMPADFLAVGYWYEHFDQTRDEEVIDLLERRRREVAYEQIAVAGRPGACS